MAAINGGALSPFSCSGVIFISGPRMTTLLTTCSVGLILSFPRGCRASNNNLTRRDVCHFHSLYRANTLSRIRALRLLLCSKLNSANVGLATISSSSTVRIISNQNGHNCYCPQMVWKPVRTGRVFSLILTARPPATFTYCRTPIRDSNMT